jgi:hypothetical protein
MRQEHMKEMKWYGKKEFERNRFYELIIDIIEQIIKQNWFSVEHPNGFTDSIC